MKSFLCILVLILFSCSIGTSQDFSFNSPIDTVIQEEQIPDSEEQITSLDLTGSIQVMVLIIGFPDRTHSWPKFANDPSYPDEYFPLQGAFPDETTLREYIATNGPINVEEWIEPGFEIYLEKYSGGKYTADAIFPKRGTGEPFLTTNSFQHWINLNMQQYQDTSINILEYGKPYAMQIINEAAYNLVNYIPDSNPFEGIDMIQVSFVGITRAEFWVDHGGYTFGGTQTIRNPYNPNEVYYTGSLGISHQTGPILHEALHNIGMAVGSPQGFIGLPDRGHDRKNYQYDHFNATSTYDIMWHNAGLLPMNSLYGDVPLLSYDMIYFGWIEEDEILQINNQNNTNIRLENIADPLTTEQLQGTPPVYRIVKVMINENYQNDWDEYFLIEYHNANDQEINFDKCLHNQDEGLYNEGVLIWHIKEIRNMMNVGTDQLYDLELAQPYNGFYGNPIPDDDFPRDYDRDFDWNGQWAGDFDWLDDHEWNTATKKFYYLPDGGRNIWEITVPPEIFEGGHYPWDPTGEDWFIRCNSLRSDFFTDEEVRGVVINKMTDVTRPSTKDWAGDPTHIAIINIRDYDTYAMLDVYYDYTTIYTPINSGWQLVSVPVVVEDFSTTAVYPTATASVFEYVPGVGYQARDTLKNGLGYWTKFDSAQTLEYSGTIIDSISIGISSGWNIIGSISSNVLASEVCTNPPGIISAMYAYNNGYVLLGDGSLIKPGIGYWVNANNSGNVILSGSCGMQKGTSYPQIELEELDKFTITDSNGKQQTLYVANVDIDSTLLNLDRTMPPPMPNLEFDARFNYGEIIKVVSTDSGEVDLEILVESNSYPITLSWELNPENGIDYSFISDSGLGKVSQISIENGQTEFSENSQGRIQLFGKISDSFTLNQLPDKFELYQNYPNPFNPTTTIKYDISDVSQVSVIIYDILGRKLKDLVNEKQDAGRYEIQFDATDLATGVYLYQIRAGSFVSTKKMILIK
jgi:hypothetical protein